MSNSLLSRSQILDHIKKGNIIITPKIDENIRTVSVDVTLGEYYFRPKLESRFPIYNPWDEQSVKTYWGGPQKAVPAKKIFDGNLPNGIGSKDQVIMIFPNELLLCHTNEFIGGRNNVTTMMKARSTIGRSGISVCKCAGWGDVGYINRWTMEIHNTLPLPVPLVVGRRVAQIAFFEVDMIGRDDYTKSKDTKYQLSQDIKEIKKSWKPEDMLPKMWKDREVLESI